MKDRPETKQEHVSRLVALMRIVTSARQRRMLRTAIDHVRRRDA